MHSVQSDEAGSSRVREKHCFVFVVFLNKMSIFAVVFLCGLICVGSGEAKRPSWKDCKVEKKLFYYKLYPVRNCAKKGFETIPGDIFSFSNQYKYKYL